MATLVDAGAGVDAEPDMITVMGNVDHHPASASGSSGMASRAASRDRSYPLR
jgi:hypothetical protein